MRVRQLKIVNHSRVSDLDVAIRKHAVIVGPNNAGKSAILRCLAGTLNPSAAALYQTFALSDLRDSTAAMTVTVTLESFTDAERAAFPDAICIAVDGESLTVQLSIESDDADSVSIRREFVKDGVSLKRPTREQLQAIGLRFVPAVRGIDVDSAGSRPGGLRDLLRSVALGASEQKLREIQALFNGTLASTAEIDSLLQSMAEHLSLAMPEVITKDRLSLRTTLDSERNVLADTTLFMKSNDGNDRPLDAHSDGTRSLMAMTFHDLSAATANMVLIDEPESHLHPAGQRALATLLNGDTNQKIIATHSPFIVQRFHPEHVLAFSPQGDLRQIIAGRFDSEPTTLTHWWNSQRLESLTARYVVFVEGTADRIILARACAALGLNADQLGISILELSGAGGFKAAYSLFGPQGFDVGVLGLVDEDAEASWSAWIDIDVNRLADNGIFVCRQDLEDEYVAAIGATETWKAISASGLFSRNELDNLIGSSTSTVDVADWARRYKVRASMVVESLITQSVASKMKSICQLVSHIRSL